MRNKFIFGAPISAITLLVTVPPVFALTPYESGYQHGVEDAKGLTHYYATPGKGPEFHTQDFRQGYIDGWCATTGGAGSDANYATFDCSEASSGR